MTELWGNGLRCSLEIKVTMIYLQANNYEKSCYGYCTHCLILGQYWNYLLNALLEELVYYFLELLNARDIVPKSVEMIVPLFIVPELFLILKQLYNLRVVPTGYCEQCHQYQKHI